MDKLIKLQGANDEQTMFIYPRDVVIMQESSYNNSPVSYYIGVKNVQQWLNVDAHSYFKVMAILGEVAE